MYIVKIKDGQTVAICSRKEDAEAYLSGQELDKTIYVIEEVKNVRNG